MTPSAYIGLKVFLDMRLAEIRPDFYPEDLSSVKEENFSSVCNKEMRQFVQLNRVNKEFNKIVNGILDDFAKKLFNFRNKAYEEKNMRQLIVRFQPNTRVFLIFWKNVKEAPRYFYFKWAVQKLMEELDKKVPMSEPENEQHLSELRQLVMLNKVNKKFNELVNGIFDEFAAIKIQQLNIDFIRQGIENITYDPKKKRPLIAFLEASKFYREINQQAVDPSLKIEEKKVDPEALKSFMNYVAYLKDVNRGDSDQRTLEDEIIQRNGKPSHYLRQTINEYCELCLDSGIPVPVDEIDELLGNNAATPQQRVEAYIERCINNGEDISEKKIEELMRNH